MDLNPETVTILLNLGALVWGAAKISSSVDHLDKTVTKLQSHMEEAEEERADHDKRISLLEHVVPGLEQKRRERADAQA